MYGHQKNRFVAHRILSDYPRKFERRDVPEPQTLRSAYSGLLEGNVAKLLSTPLSQEQAQLISEALYAAYQMGRTTPTPMPATTLPVVK
jgi:hypothetical protein